MTSTPSFPSFGLQRRHLLGGALAVSMVQMAPLSWATAPVPATASSFMALSQYLTARSDLNPKLAARMQSALQALDGQFNAQVDALWSWIDSQHVALDELTTRVKAEQPALAHVPAQVMQVWYLGVAGSGTKARAVTYEFALNAQTVSDKLKPPTYAYGSYGSWTSNPTQFNLKRIPTLA